jgi:hypothetical protein
MRGGKFFGFRILKFKGDPGFWTGVDLAPGDVVTRVNGFSVGTPDEAHDALQSLDVSSELKVEFEREGKLRELRYSIVDDVGPSAPPPQPPGATTRVVPPSASAPPSPAASAPKN